MRTDVFFDTNVLVYLVSGDPAKSAKSDSLVRAGGLASVQVLNELTRVMRRKFNANWPAVDAQLAGIRAKCTVVPITVAIHERGLVLAKRFQFQVYDSMIVAAAVLAGCTTLYSEDMNDGQIIDGLTIRNPYRP